MAFNLSASMGYDKIVSKLDTGSEIQKIPIEKLDASEKNFFTVNDVQDLMESIQLVGLLDPLVVVQAGDRYRLIAGHRRKKALDELSRTDKRYNTAPCIVLPDMSKDLEMVTLIQSNTTARELTSYEKAEAALRLKKHLVELKKQGLKIPGRLRDIVAEQMQISASEVARMEVINKNLSDDWKPFWKENKLPAVVAYEIARLPAEDQKELFDAPRDPRLTRMDIVALDRFKLEKQCRDWMITNCPHPLGWSDAETAKRGEPVPCRNLEKILAHRADAWAHDKKDACTGCCASCDSLPDCKEACQQAKSHAYSQRKMAERADKYDVSKEQVIYPEPEERKKEDPSRSKAIEAFSRSPLANISKNLRVIMDQSGYTEWIVAQRWNVAMTEFFVDFGDDEEGYEEGDVQNVLEAEEACDLYFMIPEFLALCNAVGTTPDRILGLSDPSVPAGWHDFRTDKPADGQKVVAMRVAGAGSRFYSEYIYKQEKGKDAWYFSEIPDTQASISNVVAWIEAPEEDPDGGGEE